MSERIDKLNDSEFALLFPSCLDTCRDRHLSRHHSEGGADYSFAKMIGQKLSEELKTFIHADTLKDKYSQAEAEDLFELGRLRVVLEAPRIREALERVEHSRISQQKTSGHRSKTMKG